MIFWRFDKRRKEGFIGQSAVVNAVETLAYVSMIWWFHNDPTRCCSIDSKVC